MSGSCGLAGRATPVRVSEIDERAEAEADAPRASCVMESPDRRSHV